MISASLEDYLEFIHNTIKQNKEIKAIDISNHFKISRPSVSEALIRLMDLDLIIYEGRKGIKITQKGVKEAQKIINKHNILFDFFNQILMMNNEISTKNACDIEHVIDDKTIKKLKEFNLYCKKNSIPEAFKESKQ